MLKILIGFGRLFFFEDELVFFQEIFLQRKDISVPVFGFGSDDSMSLSLS